MEVEKEQGEMGMRWQDRLMLKMMSNKLVIKIFSIPIVMKLLMWETKVIISIMSIFKRKKAEEKTEVGEKTEGDMTENEKTKEEDTTEEKTDSENTEL